MQIQATNKPGLYEKLETKHLAYPRFYFVSSADLLDILSNGNVPERGLLNINKIVWFNCQSNFQNGNEIGSGNVFDGK